MHHCCTAELDLAGHSGGEKDAALNPGYSELAFLPRKVDALVFPLNETEMILNLQMYLAVAMKYVEGESQETARPCLTTFGRSLPTAPKCVESKETRLPQRRIACLLYGLSGGAAVCGG